jgi:Co/Zn/Cd efflux system component
MDIEPETDSREQLGRDALNGLVVAGIGYFAAVTGIGRWTTSEPVSPTLALAIGGVLGLAVFLVRRARQR